MRISEQKLENGLSLVRVPSADTRVVTSMIAFPAGARFEQPEENGIAHFLEHLVFKGGQNFPTSKDIHHRAEELGASLNAFTSHDFVAFHITSCSDVADQALDLLTDFTANPQFDSSELEKERAVVIQEIAQDVDKPSTVANYLVDKAAYGDHPLGRPILGSAENISSFTPEHILNFKGRTWREGCVIIAGAVDQIPEHGLNVLNRFASTETAQTAPLAPEISQEVLIEQRDSAQSHLCLQWRPQHLDVSKPDQRTSLAIYSAILGGMAGSRLFEEIREKQGFCYYIAARGFPHSDVAELAVGTGLDPNHLSDTYQQILDIVEDLRINGPTHEEVERAKSYLRGTTICALESSESVAGAVTRQKVVHNQLLDPEEVIKRIENSTYDNIREVAEMVVGQPAVGLVGPHAEL